MFDEFETLLVERSGHVLTVTLHRPEQRNAFDFPMRWEMIRLWAATRADREIRCIVLTGAGDGFCAGADMGDLDGEREPFGDGIDDELGLPPRPQRRRARDRGGQRGLRRWRPALRRRRRHRHRQCRAAWFTDPHVNVGQVSGIEAPSLAMRVPLGALTRLVLCGRAERWDAHQALELGLVSEVVAPERLLARAQELAAGIAASSPEAVRASQGGYPPLRGVGRRRGDGRRLRRTARHWAHPDADEGPRAIRRTARSPRGSPDGLRSRPRRRRAPHAPPSTDRGRDSRRLPRCLHRRSPRPRRDPALLQAAGGRGAADPCLAGRVRRPRRFGLGADRRARGDVGAPRATRRAVHGAQLGGARDHGVRRRTARRPGTFPPSPRAT